MATFYQERGADLVRVAGGLLLSSDQLTFWAERSEKRAPLVVSLRVTFGAVAPIDSAVQSFGPGAPTLTATLLTDADSNSQVTPGDTLRYRLTIPNAGADIPNVVATIPLSVYHTTVPGTLNVSPFALDLADTTPEDVPLPLVLAGTDAEGQVLTYTIVTPPAHGALVPLTPGSANQTYTPAADYHGPDSFTYRVNDGRLDSNEDGTVTLTVTPRNDAPSFTKGADVTVLEDSGPYSRDRVGDGDERRPRGRSRPDADVRGHGNTNAALFSIAPAIALDGRADLHAGGGHVRERHDHADAVGRRRDGERRRGHVGAADVPHHGHQRQRRAELHQGRRSDRARGRGRADGGRLGDGDQRRPERKQPDAHVRDHRQHQSRALLVRSCGQRGDRQPDLHAGAERLRHGDDHAADYGQRRDGERRRGRVADADVRHQRHGGQRRAGCGRRRLQRERRRHAQRARAGRARPATPTSRAARSPRCSCRARRTPRRSR